MRTSAWALLPALIGLVCAVPGSSDAQTNDSLHIGPNVNMVSGTTWPDGDPFLQRQNEPSLAVSTRGSMRLMGFANDYRSVDIPGLPEGKETGDAWLGVFKSLDGGMTWRSTLLPGFPQDQEATTPIHGYEAAADPVVRAGTHGLFYLSGIVFDRGDIARSAVFVTRYMDLANRESGDPIEYLDTTVIKANLAGEPFIDKPWMAVDIPRANAQTVQLVVDQDGTPVEQAVACGNVYLAWAEIWGLPPDRRSAIMFSRSTDCGTTWSPPIQLSADDTLSQGVSLAVSPNDGAVWVTWRQFETDPAVLSCGFGGGYWQTHVDDWPLDVIEMGGVTYSKAEALDIVTTSKGGDATYILAKQLIPAKLNMAFSMAGGELLDLIIAADDWLVANPLGSKPRGDAQAAGLAIKDELEVYNEGLLVPEGCTTGVVAPGTANAIVASCSVDSGLSFAPPTIVAPVYPFEQGTSPISFRTNAYPTITVDAASPARAYVAWTTRGEASPRSDPIEGDGRIVVSTSRDAAGWSTPAPIPVDNPVLPGHQVKPSITFAGGKVLLTYLDLREDRSGLFERFIADWPSLETYRHTVDVRAAAADPADAPVFTDYSLSRPSEQVSRYVFIPYPADPDNPDPDDVTLLQYQFNPPNLPIFVGGTRAFFGDYIDAVPSPPFLPDDIGGWRFNTDAADGAMFHAAWTDNRDVEAPLDGDWSNYVPPQNANSGGPSLFDPNQTVPDCNATPGGEGQTRIRNQNVYTARISSGLFVAAPGSSRAVDAVQRAFTVFVRNDTQEDRVFRLEIPAQAGVDASFEQFSSLHQIEVEIPGFSSVSRTVFVESSQEKPSVRVTVAEIDGLGGAKLTGGLASSILLNPDPTSPPAADPGLEAGEVYNPAMMNPAMMNLAMMNPAMMNTTLSQAMYALAMMNPAMMNLAMMNLAMMNPAMMNLAMMNLAMMNPAMMNPAMMNPAVLSLAMMNPAMMNPAMMNLAMMNPAMMNLAMMNPAMMNASLTDVTWEVSNEGNATAAYSVKMIMDEPPEGFVYQLLVYGLYETPVADGCELTEEAQQQMLVNIMDPDLFAESLLDPGTIDPDIGNATFWVEPGDTVYVTLRVIDPDAEDELVFDPTQVSAAVVAQAVNTEDAAAGSTQPPYATQLAASVPPLVVTSPPVLPDVTEDTAYSFNLTATGGLGTLTWMTTPGSVLPPGLTLAPTGLLTGTPTAAGDYVFAVQVTDSATQITTQTVSLTVSGAPMTPTAQRNALIALYNSTTGAAWTHRDNWRNPGDTDFNDPGTECTWYGITCDVAANVTTIDLTYNNLVGPLPAELENLSGLQLLDLRANSLTGSIPPEIGTIVSLQHLDLGYAGWLDPGGGLSGTIPPSLGALSNLTYLALDTNSLSGSIPPELGNLTNLQWLYSSFNQLTGSIPPQLGGLSNLLTLALSYNQLTGTIPPQLGDLSNVQRLTLAQNQLSGAIPPELGNLTNLQRLDLAANLLTGGIPVELGSLASLTELYLYSNQLSGSIPAELGDLAALRRLRLDWNQLSGSIPPELGNLTNLWSLVLSSNQLGGSIPAELGTLSALRSLQLSANQLSGSIPVGLASLANLQDLDLDGNQLSGSIPAELGSLSNLRTLSLATNQLTGGIPPELGGLSNLQQLNLKLNQLSGSIPPELGNLSSLEILDLHWNQLGGPIPAELGSLSQLFLLALSSNQLDSLLPVELANLTNLQPGWTDLRWNALLSPDAGLTAFLNSKQMGGDWQSTQTVPPADFAAGSPTSSSVTLSWTPIAYTADGGGYEAYYATTLGGPYTTFGRTGAKTVESMVVDGLAPTTTYYLYLQTVTEPHAHNQNTVYSNPTAEVSATTAAPLAITTAALPYGLVGSSYSQALVATGGEGAYSWGLASGSLPAGVGLGSTGVVSGTPGATSAGSYSFTAQVTDGSQTATKSLTLTVNHPQLTFVSQPTDTPAGVPMSTFQVQLVDVDATPLPGFTITLTVGSNPCGGPTFGTILSVTDPTGIALFSGIVLNSVCDGYTLVATASPTINSTSVPFNIQ